MQLVVAETCRATGSATYHRKLPAQVSVLSCTVIMWNYDELCVFFLNEFYHGKFAGPREALDQSACSHGRNAPKEGRRGHMITHWNVKQFDCSQTANNLRIATLWDIS